MVINKKNKINHINGAIWGIKKYLLEKIILVWHTKVI